MKKGIAFKTLSVLTLAGLIFVFYSFIIPGQQKPPAKWDIPTKYQAMKNPVKSDAGSLKIGKMLFAKHCKACHGVKGLGDGPKAAMLKTKLPKFNSPVFQKQTDGVIYYQSIIGRDEMPNFEKKIPETEDRWAVINYLRTLK